MRILAIGLLVASLLSGCTGPDGAPAAGAEREHPLSASTFTWEPYFPTVGEPVWFQPTIRSSAPGDELLGLKWDVGGVVSTDTRPVHTFWQAGDHEVRVTIQTREGGRYTLNDTVEVLPAEGARPDAPRQPTPGVDVAPPVIHAEVNQSTVRFSFAFDSEAQTLHWSFGDGTESQEPEPVHTYTATGDYEVGLRVLSDDGVFTAGHNVTIEEVPFLPHVLVAVPDTGINPYHEMFRRPDLTAHPCTYILDFPCAVPALNLTLDAPTWQAAFEADREEWEAIKPGDWFWIPGTVFVAVGCDDLYDPANGDLCILDDSHMHGTGTVSSVLTENPGALIAFAEVSGGDVSSFVRAGLPVDVYSVSWGYNLPPIPALPGWSTIPSIYVKSAGNDPRSTLVDGWSGYPSIISVGGAYAGSDSEEAMASKQPEIVSYYCRPTAQTKALTGMRERYCGTSFAAPTAAGGISKVILALREHSGYTGSVEGGLVDPILGVSVGGLRDAVNRTASYDPENQYDERSLPVPLNPAAPYVQWGWGFYDGLVADATIEHLLGREAPPKPDDAVLYMETVFTAKQATHPF